MPSSLDDDDFPRRPITMAAFQIDQQRSDENNSDDISEDEYDDTDRPLVTEGAVAEARNQKSVAMDRENIIIAVALLIGTLAALVVLAATDLGRGVGITVGPTEISIPPVSTSAPSPVPPIPVFAAAVVTESIPATVVTQQETANTGIHTLATNPPLDLSCNVDDTSSTSIIEYWATYMDTASSFGTLDSDRCGALPSGRTCRCFNPIVPTSRSSNIQLWYEAFQRNLQLIADTVTDSDTGEPTNTGDLDVVLLGDSIIEHMLGTDLGKPKRRWRDVVSVYLSLFQHANKKTTGLALGIGGDQCPQLLYRLLHGEMAELSDNATTFPSAALQPTVWWILIGTNDFGGAKCESDQIVTGTVRIVQEILKRRPAATVVVNSILPRGRYGVLGPGWFGELTTVNHQMECYAESQPRVEFFNATDYFVMKGDGSNDDHDDEVRVNQTLMSDEVHPSAEGYRIWGQGIVDRVHEIKQRKSKV